KLVFRQEIHTEGPILLQTALMTTCPEEVMIGLEKSVEIIMIHANMLDRQWQEEYLVVGTRGIRNTKEEETTMKTDMADDYRGMMVQVLPPTDSSEEIQEKEGLRTGSESSQTAPSRNVWRKDRKKSLEKKTLTKEENCHSPTSKPTKLEQSLKVMPTAPPMEKAHGEAI
ncbi:hypothetical protein Celaphus_00005536, partial [Cervus elaphus hippelaphus]